MEKIWVIIPAFNEAKSIGHVVADLKKEGFSIVVIDDGSTDETFICAQGSGAIIIRHDLNLGQGAALQTGIDYALKKGADIIVTFDADGQMDPLDIKKVIAPIQNNEVDVVLGSRFLNKADGSMPRLRKALLKMAVIYSQLTTGLKISDTHNGFRAFSREEIIKFKISQNRMAHASEILQTISKNKCRYTEVAVGIRYTTYSLKKGQKNFSLFNILWDLFLKG